MRVGLDAHTLGRRQTGNETYMRELLGGLTAIGDPDVEYVCYHTSPDGSALSGAAWQSLAGRGRIRRVWPGAPLVRVPVGFPLALYRDRVDVAHFQYVSPPVAPCPIVLMVHDISFESNPEFLPWLQAERLRWLVPRSIRRAAHTVTVSHFTRQQMLERYGLHPDRVTVTHEAAGPAFKRVADPVALRVALDGLDIPERYILAVGNLQPRKNLRTLLEAYASLVARDRIEQTLVLVGQVHYKGNAVLDHIERLGLRDRVRWTGYVPEPVLVALYNLADLFVFPTLYEGFGLPVLEAMACGAPVVSTNVTSIPEVSGDAAVLVDPRSVSEFTSAIERVVTDSATRDRLRERGFQQAARFSWAKLARQTLEVYKRCA